MAKSELDQRNRTWILRCAWLVPVLTAGLAVTSLLRDSITFDETKHFAAGLSHLKTGDFRMAPDTPPLGQMLLSLPAIIVKHQWPSVDAPGWRQGDIWVFGRYLLFEHNDGPSWIIVARCMAVLLMIGLCILVYFASKSLFGDGGAFISLYVVCLSPVLLAHGRLVTTDLPIAFAAFASIFSFAELVQRVALGRLLCLILALSCACLTKFSWPVIIPSLLAIAAAAVIRTDAISLCIPGKSEEIAITSWWRKLCTMILIAAASGLGVFACIWTCYGMHYSPYRGPDAEVASMLALSTSGREAATEREASWKMTLEDASGKPLKGMTASFIRFARNGRLLPEAYLFGLAFTLKTVQGQPTFLLGDVSDRAHWAYFPIAFLLKTPIAILLLLALGVVTFVLGSSPRCKDPLLLVGLLSFVVIYSGVAVLGNLNLGHRHLLPIYPPLFVLLGRAVQIWQRKWGRAVLACCLTLFTVESLAAYPSYLSYFNWMAGGPVGGREYLLDSNIDWGQDLVRLRDYLRSRQEQSPIKLSYFGSADPNSYGIKCEVLPSHLSFDGPSAELEAGTYVVSLNQLHGLYMRQIRDEFWKNPKNRETYYELTARFGHGQQVADESDEQRKEREYAESRFHLARQWRLLNRLQHREPDDRVGWSMLVFHLSEREIEEMLAPY